MHPFSVAERGWIPKALTLIDEGGLAFEIAVGGEDAKKIVTQIQDVTSRLPILEIFKTVKRHFPLVGSIPVDPVMVVPILASIGALGGAAGAAAFVAGVAVSRGYEIAFRMDLGKLFDPSDDRMAIQLTPPKTKKKR